MPLLTRLCVHTGEPHPRGTCPSKHRRARCCPHPLPEGISNAVSMKRSRAKWRAACLAHYGGKCACCGEATPHFLTLDHKNGDGAEHRRSIGDRKANMYYWAYKEGFPDLLQLLCWNCNCARGFHGVCH